MKFFYQAHDFYAGQFTKTLSPKFDGFNERIALWFIAWLNNYSPVLLGGLVRDFEKNLSSLEIEMPYKNGILDLGFIESRIRELEESRIRELEAFLSEAGFDDCTLTPYETETLHAFLNHQIKFKEFSICDEIFKVSNSHNILKSSVTLGSGEYPYVTASEGNNSIAGYIDYKKELLEKGNVILIGGKTCVITYQPSSFFSNDSHNLVLDLRDEEHKDESVYLFLTAALSSGLKPKYSWGDSISKAKIKNDSVSLPYSEDGIPDYRFMSSLISAIKKEVIQSLRDFINREHNTYLNVIQNSKQH